MRLIPSDPDIETIFSRIKNGDIDLQPDFQRGEVWSRSKKQRLIDSVLRDWHVPPIHVIEDLYTRKQEVLDGQQRLVAIRDFLDGEFTLDGTIEPVTDELLSLHGCKYREMPESVKRRFNQFTIRLFRIVDYNAREPGELFFRLNQPTSLTGAEQRNAFFGPVRSQIKKLVSDLDRYGLGKDFIGFSNSRMAYDDVLARVALSIERNCLDSKLASADLIELYRSDVSLKWTTIEVIEYIIAMLSEVRDLGWLPIKFNKATLFSWMIFIARNKLSDKGSLNGILLREFLVHFEGRRAEAVFDYTPMLGIIDAERFFGIYESRSSSRVADVSSVILRDAIIWIAYFEFLSKFGLDDSYWCGDIESLVDAFLPDFESPTFVEDDAISRSILQSGWGVLV